MASFIGRSGHKILFGEDERGVIVDSRVAVVIASGSLDEMSSALEWSDGEFSATDEDIANIALSSMAEPVPELTGRLYTIPLGAQKSAKRGLAEASESTSKVSLSIGSILASGGQMDFNGLVNIANYFERNDNADSLNLEDDSTPTRSTEWKLRGGDAGRRWASAIVAREPVTAAAPPSVDSLVDLLKNNPEAGPEFIARVAKDGSGIDRLYRIDIDGSVYVWDDSVWDDLGHADWTIWDFDIALDGGVDRQDLSLHVSIDPESAVKIAKLFSAGTDNVYVEDVEMHEAKLAMDAIVDEDWEVVDDALIAATAVGAQGDGIYSEEERSKNASNQVRDATGRFATMGTQMVDPNNLAVAGKIINIDSASGNATLLTATGMEIEAQVSDLTPGTPPPGFVPGKPLEIPRVDFSGILAEPRTPINRVQGTIPGTLPAITSNDLRAIINNFPAWVKSQRDAYSAVGGPRNVGVQAKNSLNTGRTGAQIKAETGRSMTTSAYDHPLLRKWLNKKDYRGYRENKVWYRPITAAAETTEINSPEASDVEPIYMAIVSPDDPRAVFKLVSLVPASTDSTAPMVYSREEGVWSKDPQTLNELNSATPPPVVPLDSDTLQEVLVQVDASQGANSSEDGEDEGEPFDTSEFISEGAPAAETASEPATTEAPAETPEPVQASAADLDDDDLLNLSILWGPRKDIMKSVVAAGGLDRDRGGADKLRRYWTFGPGGAKIMWNTPGDWTRCVKHLGKYLGPRAKGYCALRHKEMTGLWTGDKSARQTFSYNIAKTYSTDFVADSEAVIDASSLRIQAEFARERMLGITASNNPKYTVYEGAEEAITAGAEAYVSAEGGAFFIPLALPEEAESGDGRSAEKYSITIRDLPISLLWQIKTADGHSGSVVVGMIERLGRVPGGIGAGYGHFDTGVYGREAERMVRAGMLRFVSSDMDEFHATRNADSEAAQDKDSIGGEKTKINKARVMAVTIVAKPAFQQCTIMMVPENVIQEDVVIPDGIYVDEYDPLDAEAIVAAAYVADAVPLAPPVQWFQDPSLDGPTPITVLDSGQIYGHVATWDTVHTSPQLSNVRPPRSRSKYAYFNKGVVRTEEGTDVTVGQLTLAGGHAGMQASAREAIRHYDDTASAVADVHAGEDKYGIWVAGSLRPEISPVQVRALRASVPSGDWRPIRGSLELIAVCQVNVPGFPIARAMVASGHVTALVAAGAIELAKMKSDPVTELSARLEALEQFSSRELQAKADAIRARVEPAISARYAELSTRSESVLERMESFGYVPKRVRDQAIEKGHALSDGTFAISSGADLERAISGVGRAPEASRAKIRQHIVNRARALGMIDQAPERWVSEHSETLTASSASMRETIERRKAEFASGSSTEAERREIENLLKERGVNLPEESVEPEKATAEDGDAKYTPSTQPRDEDGKFRDVLARLKDDLGVSGNQGVIDKLKEADSKIQAGDYTAAVKAGVDLKSTLDRLDDGALNAESIGNVRRATKDLGSVIANLPLPFDNQAEKVRFSDLPPALRDLVDEFITRVEDKIGLDDANSATAALRAFKSGSDIFSQGEVSKEMNKLLRLLT